MSDQLTLPIGPAFGYGCPILRQQQTVERVFADLSRDLQAQIDGTGRCDGFRDVLLDALDALHGDEWQPWLYILAARRLRKECSGAQFYDFQERIGHRFAQRFDQLERETRALFEVQKQELVRFFFAA